jgi:hypothetical protein
MPADLALSREAARPSERAAVSGEGADRDQALKRAPPAGDAGPAPDRRAGKTALAARPGVGSEGTG